MKTIVTYTQSLRKTSRRFLTSLFLSITTFPVLAGTITGTAHDFSGSGWSGGEICIACHTPHNADATVTDAPLWNHNLSTQSYALYDSPTLNATTSQPTGTSKLCLSCHDGTVAYDNTAGGTTMSGNSAVGRGTLGLSDDHPISFDYNAALVTADGALHPVTRTVTIGAGADSKTGSINDVMLIAGQVQCATCHDVHNKFTDGANLLRISNAGSGLCLTCHNK